MAIGWTVQSFSLVLFVFHISNAIASEWRYSNPRTGPNHWVDHYQTCGPIRQSPINLQNSDTTYDQNLKKIKISGNLSVLQSNVKYIAENGGSIAVIQFPKDTWFVSFTDHDEPHYSVVQLHMHWGSESTHGAEHLLNGKAYPLEAQLLIYNRLLYPNASLAARGAEGFVVLGFWAELSSSVEEKDTLFAALGNSEESLADIKPPGAMKLIDAFDLSKILHLVDSSAYYRYAGSLTVPPCTPNVIWTIFKKPVAVTEKQLTKLRSLKSSGNEIVPTIQNNYRPVQPLNNKHSLIRRNVFVSWNHATRTTKPVSLLLILELSKLR